VSADRANEFSARLMRELYSRYQVCEDFAATPSSVLLATVNAIAKVREDMGYGNPDNISTAWRAVRSEDVP
jgi:hypothetical protein